MAESSDNQRRVSARVATAEDRISALPDDLLRRVLSQLTSREAVHTSLLAQRWRHLWRSVPVIDVTFEEFQDRDAEDDFEREGMFKKFVNTLLMHRDPVAVDEFRLLYSSSTDDGHDDANLWISYALQHNARVVKLQTSCPALEYLFLCECFIEDLEIFSNSLKVLILYDEIKFLDHASISAPSLISLSIYGDFRMGMLPILHNMASLETASVVLWGDIDACDAHAITQLLASLSGVTSLNFCYGANELTMENNFQWCPTFTNLTNLTLDAWCVHADFYGLIVFLQKSPCLKKLTLKLTRGDWAAITGELEERSFTCEQLEIVEIICWETSDLLSMVTQFLRDSGIRRDQMRISHQN